MGSRLFGRLPGAAFVLLGVCALSNETATADGEREGTGGAPRLAVRPLRSAFADARSVALDVRIENEGPKCLPVFVDTAFVASPFPHRPGTVLEIRVKDNTGRAYDVDPSQRSDLRMLRSHDLLLLDCGASYGRTVPLSHPDWVFALGKGEYRVTVCAASRVGPFLEGKPAIAEELQKAFSLRPDSYAATTRVWTACSDEVRFRVLQ